MVQVCGCFLQIRHQWSYYNNYTGIQTIIDGNVSEDNLAMAHYFCYWKIQNSMRFACTCTPTSS